VTGYFASYSVARASFAVSGCTARSWGWHVSKRGCIFASLPVAPHFFLGLHLVKNIDKSVYTISCLYDYLSTPLYVDTIMSVPLSVYTISCLYDYLSTPLYVDTIMSVPLSVYTISCLHHNLSTPSVYTIIFLHHYLSTPLSLQFISILLIVSVTPRHTKCFYRTQVWLVATVLKLWSFYLILHLMYQKRKKTLFFSVNCFTKRVFFGPWCHGLLFLLVEKTAQQPWIVTNFAT